MAEQKKPAGWFSRRHQTNEEHLAAQIHRPVPKDILRIEAEARQSLRDKRSDMDQLLNLIERGHGNCAEAKRLRDSIRLSGATKFVDDVEAGSATVNP
jgi:hypothetical protein